MSFGHLSRLIYSLVLYVISPMIFLRLWWRGKKLPAYRQRWGERLALFPVLSKQPRIWLHAVSVGEVNAAAALIEMLLTETNYSVLVTTTTPTGSSLLQARFSERIEHVYFPYDFPGVIKRFLRKTKPAICIIIETELWPNCFHHCRKQRIPLIIVNARLSERSVRGYQRMQALTRQTLQATSRIFAQGKEDAERFIRLGAKASSVSVIGNLKFDIQLLEETRKQGVALRSQWPAYQFIWIAASTHAGEEERLINVQKKLLKKNKNSLLVIVPRHPERFDQVAELCESSGLLFTRRSNNALLPENTKLYLADTLGELNMLYGTVDVAFMAGSFTDVGGHNPLEPAAHGIPIITGAVFHNFSEIYTKMFERNAALLVNNENELFKTLLRIANDNQLKNQLGRASKDFMENNQGGLQRVAEYIGQQLP